MKGENDFSSRSRNPSHSAAAPDADRDRLEVPDNIFHPELPASLPGRLEEPPTALEAELRGPWRVVQTAPLPQPGQGDRTPERWAVVRTWEEAGHDTPNGSFEERERALLYAAALAVAARRPRLEVGRERDELGLVVSELLPGPQVLEAAGPTGAPPITSRSGTRSTGRARQEPQSFPERSSVWTFARAGWPPTPALPSHAPSSL